MNPAEDSPMPPEKTPAEKRAWARYLIDKSNHTIDADRRARLHAEAMRLLEEAGPLPEAMSANRGSDE